MYNETKRIKIRDKFKLLKHFKISNPNTYNLFNSRKKSNEKKDKINSFYKKYIQKNLAMKYNTLPEKYALIQINNFIKEKHCHSFSHFKENLKLYYPKELIKEYYTKKESLEKIPYLAEFFKAYLHFFCSPTLKELKFNILIEQMVQVKAIDFYKKNYENEEDDKDKEKSKYINSIFFTNKIRKDISRKNTLSDLSKTTIKFNNMNKNTNTNSYKSINSLIKQMDTCKNHVYKGNILWENNIGNLTERNIKKVDNKFSHKYTIIGSTKNIKLKGKNISKKRPKKTLNLNYNNQKIGHISTNNTLSNMIMRMYKNEQIFSTKPSIINNAKPIYHKINIVNNKIIIINNDSKSKKNIIIKKGHIKESKRKIKKKINKTIESRNIINNTNNSHSFYNSIFKTFDYKDKTLKTASFNAFISSKTLSKQNKNSFKIIQNIKNKIKKIDKIRHINIIKEKNLTLKPKKFLNIQTDNNNIKSNLNILSSFMNEPKTERYNQREKKKQRLTNFQMFNKNSKRINSIKFFDNSSIDKLSFNGIKSTTSILSKNSKIRSALKKNTLSSIQNLRKSTIKIKNGSNKKISNKKLNQSSNFKIMPQLINYNKNIITSYLSKNNKYK